MEISRGHRRGHQSSGGILSPCSTRLSIEPNPMALSDVCLLQLRVFVPRTTLMLESYRTVFSTAQRSILSSSSKDFLLHQRGPKGRVPCGKPPLSHRPCPTPWRGHTSISPRSTRPAAHSSKRLWGLRHELFSITARSPSHTGVPTRSTCPDKWQLEAIPAARCWRAESRA